MNFEDAQTIIKETDSDFATMKDDFKKLNAKKKNLQCAIEKMSEKGRPQESIDKKRAELESVEKEVKAKWIVEFREQVQKPHLFKAGEMKTIE